VLDATALGPGDEGLAGELRPVVGAHRTGIKPPASVGGPRRHR
jgi:hypothetical protein